MFDVAVGFALAEHLAAEEDDHDVLVLPRVGWETSLSTGTIEILVSAPAVFDGDRGIEPATSVAGIDRDAVTPEFEIREGIISQ